MIHTREGERNAQRFKERLESKNETKKRETKRGRDSKEKIGRLEDAKNEEVEGDGRKSAGEQRIDWSRAELIQ